MSLHFRRVLGEVRLTYAHCGQTFAQAQPTADAIGGEFSLVRPGRARPARRASATGAPCGECGRGLSAPSVATLRSLPLSPPLHRVQRASHAQAGAIPRKGRSSIAPRGSIMFVRQLHSCAADVPRRNAAFASSEMSGLNRFSGSVHDLRRPVGSSTPHNRPATQADGVLWIETIHRCARTSAVSSQW